MPTAQLQFKSTNDSATIEEVIQRLRKLDGVVNIGKEDTVEGVSGIIIFENAELAAAARNRTDYADIVTLIDPALDKPAKSSAAARKKKESARKGTTTISTAELFVAPPPSAQQPRRPESQGKRQQRPANGEGRGRGRGEGRGRRGGAAPTAEQNGDEQRVNRRRGPSNRQRPRTITAYVACVHNVPYSATNDMVFHAFKHTGHILDIARAERLALLYMREPEQVTEAIVQMNGKPFMNSVLAVCSGGEMKLPVPPPPQQPQEQLPPANPHVIEAVPPTVTA